MNELLEHTYVIRYKIIAKSLQGTDINSWYLKALIKWLNDYIPNTLLPLYKERAITIRDYLVDLDSKDIVVGSDLSAQMVDVIIFMLLSRRDVYEETKNN